MKVVWVVGNLLGWVVLIKVWCILVFILKYVGLMVGFSYVNYVGLVFWLLVCNCCVIVFSVCLIMLLYSLC